MSLYFRQLIIVNTVTKKIVHTRMENATGNAARITKSLYNLLMQGDHIAYYAHSPSQIRIPMEINGRFYVKPPKGVSIKH